MRLLVTGASGFIAKNFIKYSLRKNIKIVAISRKKKEITNNNLKWVVGQFNKIDLSTIGKFDILVHFASHGTKPKERNNLIKNFKINVLNSNELILNAIKNKCKKIVIIGSSSEFGMSNVSANGVKKSDFKIPDDSYGLSKLIFNNLIIKYSKKYRCKFRIMRLFPVYGDGENSSRLYSIIKKCSKKNQNLFLENPFEIRDFSHINFVIKTLFDSLNFGKKKFKYNQTFHISESNRLTVLKFCQFLWKKFNCSGKINYKNKEIKLSNHISDKYSNWVL